MPAVVPHETATAALGRPMALRFPRHIDVRLL